MMHKKTLAQLSDALAKKQVSSVELTEIYLNRINSHNKTLNSFITIDESYSLTQAKAADNRRAEGSTNPLCGIPYANKDIFCVDGVKTTCASRMLDNFIAPYTATAIEKLHLAGMVMLGKTNMDEFAMGSSNENSYYGPSKNPWDPTRVPGGSSGGSAAAVAARLCPAATGTDTGGSIRQPAALCGITGIKPTYGRVSRFGMIAFASSLDQGGPMAASAEDTAMMLNAMCGHDAKDSTSVNLAVPDFTENLNAPINGLTIGLPKEFFSEQLDTQIGDCIQVAINQLKEYGVKFKEISLPNTELSVPAYYVIAPAEASSNLARFDGVRYGHRCDNPVDLEDMYKRSRGEGFGDEVKRRIMVGTYALSAGYYDAYYLKAQKIRQLISHDFQQAFAKVDVILSPTSPSTAFKIGEKADDPVSMYLSDIYTIAVNLAGLPAMSVPAGFIDKLPIGMQLIGNYFAEEKILSVAHHYQQLTDWHLQGAPL